MKYEIVLRHIYQKEFSFYFLGPKEDHFMQKTSKSFDASAVTLHVARLQAWKSWVKIELLNKEIKTTTATKTCFATIRVESNGGESYYYLILSLICPQS